MMFSLNSAFPKPKEETVEKPKSYSQEVILSQDVLTLTFLILRCLREQEDFLVRRSRASPRWGRRRWRASSTTRRWPCTARTSLRRSWHRCVWVTPGKKWNSAPIRAVWCGLRKSISDPDSDLSYSHPSLNQSAESKDECDVLQGTALGKEIDPNNPWNMTGKEFDPTKSGVSSRRWWCQKAGCDSLVYSGCSLWWRDDKDGRWCLMSWNCLQVLSAIMEREPEAQPAHHHLPWN